MTRLDDTSKPIREIGSIRRVNLKSLGENAFEIRYGDNVGIVEDGDDKVRVSEDASDIYHEVTGNMYEEDLEIVEGLEEEYSSELDESDLEEGKEENRESDLMYPFQ